MNAAGGGTNKPKVVDNKVYASGGGYVGDGEDLERKSRTQIYPDKDEI